MKTFLASLLFLGALASPTLGRTASLHVDTARSTVTLYVYKTGLFSFAADNHEIAAPLHAGTLDSPLTKVELEFRSRDLRVEDPGKPVDKTAKVQARMLGPDVLDVARYPSITFKSTAIEATKDKHWKVTGMLTLHGQARQIVVPVEEVSGGRYRGSVSLRQSEFGIHPISLAGGTVKVKDGFTVEFTIVTR